MTTSDPQQILDQIKARAAATTPGEWMFGTPASGPMTYEQRSEWVQDTLAPGSDELPLWLVWTPGPGYTVIPALTGDGERAAANAEFISHARTDVDRMRGALEAVLGIESEELRASGKQEHQLWRAFGWNEALAKVFDAIEAKLNEQQEAADHPFLPVAGVPDDDECTHRDDGTDDTYCGLPESDHEWSER